MELHAFERMAQSMDASLMSACPEEGDGLLPQPRTAFPDKTPIAMAYVPYQLWGDVYEAERGICQGTMFPELDQPFHGEGGGCSV